MSMQDYKTWKKVRKPLPPRGDYERPAKGGGYRRREKHKKGWDYGDE